MPLDPAEYYYFASLRRTTGPAWTKFTALSCSHRHSFCGDRSKLKQKHPELFSSTREEYAVRRTARSSEWRNIRHLDTLKKMTICIHTTFMQKKIVITEISKNLDTCLHLCWTRFKSTKCKHVLIFPAKKAPKRKARSRSKGQTREQLGAVTWPPPVVGVWSRLILNGTHTHTYFITREKKSCIYNLRLSLIPNLVHQVTWPAAERIVHKSQVPSRASDKSLNLAERALK